MQKKRSHSWLCWAILIFAFISCWSAVTIPRPEESTHSHMRGVARRINEFASKHGHPPENLDDLPYQFNLGSSTSDGWGRQFRYAMSSNGHVTIVLTSLGADGKLGGDGANADYRLKWKLGESPGEITCGDEIVF